MLAAAWPAPAGTVSSVVSWSAPLSYEVSWTTPLGLVWLTVRPKASSAVLTTRPLWSVPVIDEPSAL